MKIVNGVVYCQNERERQILKEIKSIAKILNDRKYHLAKKV